MQIKRSLLLVITLSLVVSLGSAQYYDSNLQITDVQAESFQELSSGDVEVNIQNTGSSEIGFSIGLEECSDHFSSTSLARSNNLDPGEETTETFEVSGSSTSETEKRITGTCTVEAKNLATLQTVEESFEVTLIQQNECDPGDETVEDSTQGDRKIIKKCNDQGLGYNTVQTCNPGETPESYYEDGTQLYTCGEAPSEGPSAGSYIFWGLIVFILGGTIYSKYKHSENVADSEQE